MLRGLEGFDAQEAALRPPAEQEPPAGPALGGAPAAGGGGALEALLDAPTLEQAAPDAAPGAEREGHEADASVVKGAAPEPKGQGEVSPIAKAADAGALKIGAPDDGLEKAADDVATKALAAPGLEGKGGGECGCGGKCAGCGSAVAGKGADAKCASCGKGAGQAAAPATPAIQRKPASSGAAPRALPSSLPLPDAGQPLSDGVRARVEPAVGADLSAVRVHSGPAAQRDAAAVQAKAFAHGSHIWLGAGQSASDVGLMAHESAHVAQQAAGGAAVQAKPLVQRDLVDHLVPDWVLNMVRSAKSAVAAAPGQLSSVASSAAGAAKTQAGAVGMRAQAGVEAARSEGTAAADQTAATGQAQADQAASAARTGAKIGVAQAGAIDQQIAIADDAVDPGVAAMGGIGKGGAGAEAAGGASDAAAAAEGAKAEGAAPAAAPAAPAPAAAAPEVAQEGPASAPSPTAEGEGPAAPAPAAEEEATPAGEVMKGSPGADLGSAPPEADAGPVEVPATAKRDDVPVGASAAHPLPDWNCSEIQIIAKASKIGKAVLSTLVKGSMTARTIVSIVTAVGGGIKGAAAVLKKSAGDVVTGVKEFAANHTKGIRKRISSAMDKGKAAFDRVKKSAATRWTSISKSASESWEKLKTKASTTIRKGATTVKNRTVAAAKKAWSGAQRFWEWIPPGLKFELGAVGAMLAAPLALAYKTGEQVGKAVATHKGAFTSLGQLLLDGVAGYAANQWNLVKKVGGVALTVAEKGAKLMLAAATVNERKAYRVIAKAAGGRVTKLVEAGKEKLAESKGLVCAAAGTTVGPCAEQFLPSPDGGNANNNGFANLTGKGNLGLVIHGVPVDVSAGYGMRVSRTAKTYTVTISGEGAAQVKAAFDKKGGAWGDKEAAEKGGAFGISGTLPNKVRALMSLNGTGGSVPAVPVPIPLGKDKPATPAAAGGGGATPAAPAAPAPEVTASASLSAGLKGAVALTYTFDATADKTTCDGLGGLAAFLGGQGMAAVLPKPFSELAGGLNANAFADKLTSAKLTLANVAGGVLDLKAGPAGMVQLAAAMESGVSVEKKREAKKDAAGNDVKKDGKVVMEDIYAATLFQTISGKAGLAIAAGPVPLFNAALGASGGTTLGLNYNVQADSLSASMDTTLAGSFDFAGFAGADSLLPEGATGLAKLLPKLEREAQTGQVSAEAKFTVAAGDLRKLAGALDTHFDTTPTTTAAEVWEIVRTYVGKNVKTTGSLLIKATVTERAMGLNGALNDGKGTGAGIEAELARGKETVIYDGHT